MSDLTERQLPCADCPNMAEGDCSMRCEVWEAAYLDLFDEADELAAENAQKDIAITSLMQRVERVLVENTRLREDLRQANGVLIDEHTTVATFIAMTARLAAAEAVSAALFLLKWKMDNDSLTKSQTKYLRSMPVWDAVESMLANWQAVKGGAK